MAPLEFTRRAMYDRVWSKPMSKVATEFGISDVALKKICQKHRIPSPPRGYWAKKEAGKSVKQVRFVKTDDPLDERITIYGSNQADLPALVREILEQARAKRVTPKPSILADTSETTLTIEQTHPAIVTTAKKLRKHKPDKDGVVSAVGEGCCGVEVGVACAKRCVSVLDALARSLAAHKAALTPTGNGIVVITKDARVRFRFSEHVRHEKHIPTEDELAAEERRRKRLGITWDSLYDRAYPEWDFIRTGELLVEIENEYVSGGLRRRWKDGKHQRLEHLIDEIATGIVAYGVAVRLREEERARWQRSWERQQRIYARAEARKKRDDERQKILDELVAISTEAAKLRAWLEETKRWPERPQSDEFTRFVEWARNRFEYLEHAVHPDGIAESLKERELFPESDPLIDPPEDLVEE